VAYTETANNPLAAVIGMLGDLKTKVLKDKDSEAAAYQEYKAWCDKVTADQTHNIKVDEGKINKLKAKIDKYFADIEDSGEKIEQLIKAIASASHDAKAAKDIRESSILILWFPRRNWSKPSMPCQEPLLSSKEKCKRGVLRWFRCRITQFQACCKRWAQLRMLQPFHQEIDQS